MRHLFHSFVVAIVAAMCCSALLVSCSKGDGMSAAAKKQAQYDPLEVKSGGDTSFDIASKEAFSQPAANLSVTRKGEFFIGNNFFKSPWVIAPATTTARDGLGPLFNVMACQSCHIKDGRGHAPNSETEDADSLLVRLAKQPENDAEKARLALETTASLPTPHYGGQIQDKAIPGVQAEAKVVMRWEDVSVRFADGEVMTLRKPTLTLKDLAYGDLPETTVLSARVAQPMIGLGLLEQIPATMIQASADAEDKNQDGISGRANLVQHPVTKEMMLGRFGWKAGQPTLASQNASAFLGDIGLTTSMFPEENCTVAEIACQKAPTGTSDVEPVEVSDEIAKFVEFYTRNLAVPTRRGADDKQVLAGKKHFMALGCQSCHTPKYVLPTTDDDHIEQHGQTIFPYTDMLLHDMGSELADKTLAGEAVPSNMKVEFKATASEWRTPPLWGIGLTKTVSKEATYLHDGRARTLMEAVLWHGGEAEASKQKVLKLSKAERDELMAFLSSL